MLGILRPHAQLHTDYYTHSSWFLSQALPELLPCSDPQHTWPKSTHCSAHLCAPCGQTLLSVLKAGLWMRCDSSPLRLSITSVCSKGFLQPTPAHCSDSPELAMPDEASISYPLDTASDFWLPLFSGVYTASPSYHAFLPLFPALLLNISTPHFPGCSVQVTSKLLMLLLAMSQEERKKPTHSPSLGIGLAITKCKFETWLWHLLCWKKK